MHLYVETMDATVVDVDEGGRVCLEGEGWRVPTLQERRAIIHSAEEAIARLSELLDRLQGRTGADG